MPDIPISELQRVSSLSPSDLLVVETVTGTRAITFNDLMTAITQNLGIDAFVHIGDTPPTNNPEITLWADTSEE